MLFQFGLISHAGSKERTSGSSRESTATSSGHDFHYSCIKRGGESLTINGNSPLDPPTFIGL